MFIYYRIESTEYRIKKIIPIPLGALLAVPQISNSKSLEDLKKEHFRYSTQDSTFIKENKLQLRMHIRIDITNTSLSNIAITDIQEIFFRYKNQDSLSEGYIGPSTGLYKQNQIEFLDKFEPLISKIEKSYSSKNRHINHKVGFTKTLIDTLKIDYRNF